MNGFLSYFLDAFSYKNCPESEYHLEDSLFCKTLNSYRVIWIMNAYALTFKIIHDPVSDTLYFKMKWLEDDLLFKKKNVNEKQHKN